MKPKTCLIVDDSRVVRRIARRMLEAFEFVVDEAANGQEALTACEQAMPDVILLDWNMPVMEGIDFLRVLRTEKGGGTPIVVFCTTCSDVGHIQEALDAGANEYIIKPFDQETLQDKFSRLSLV